MAGMLDGLLDTDVGRWLLQKAAAAQGSGFDESGMMSAFMPQARTAAPAMPAANPGGMLDLSKIIGPMGGAPAGFDALDSGAIPGDEAAAAQEARDVAAGRTRRSVMRPPAPMTGEGVPYVDAVAGILSGNNPPTNDPMSGQPQLDVPLPRPRPDNLGGEEAMAQDRPGAPLSLAPQDYADKIPPNAKPIEGRAEPEGPGFLETVGKKIFDPNKAATWLALGSGFAGAGSVGTGMRRAFGNAVPAMAADRAQIMKQSTIADTYRALVSKGVPPAEALAASQNPDIMKAVAAKYFEAKPRVPHEIGTDWLGNKVMGSFDPNTGKFYDAGGELIKPKGAAGAGGVGGTTAPGGMNMLAKGVGEYNPELPAEEYMAQFGPEVQAAMRSYINGDTQPTGNPRLKGFETKVKEWARLYGDKSGTPVSDATFSERRKYRTELGSASANSAGGQAKAFNQGIEHADALAKKLEQLGNVDPIGIPSVGHGINWMRQAFSSKQTGLAKEAAAIGQTLAGEVGKLFSGAAGGGVHERELTRQRFNTITTPSELAGALEATLETMEGGLRALEGRRDSILGEKNNVTLAPKETLAKIASIREVIGRLKGEAAPAAAPGRLEPGQATTINGVTIKRLN